MSGTFTKLLTATALMSVMASGAYAKTLVYCSEGSPENFSPSINTTGTSLDAARPVFNKLVQFTGESPERLTQALYQSHHIGLTWFVFAVIGVASAVMIYLYGRWVLKLAEKESANSGS